MTSLRSEARRMLFFWHPSMLKQRQKRQIVALREKRVSRWLANLFWKTLHSLFFPFLRYVTLPSMNQ